MKLTSVPAPWARRRVASMRAASMATLLGGVLSGCIVGEDKCDKNQIEREGDLIVCGCAEGAVPDPRGYGCIKCGENEEVKGSACECKNGFVRPSAGMACQAATGGVLGAACSTTAPCAEPYPYCAPSDGEGFCTTQGCAGHEDCAVDWRCNGAGESAFCEKPAGLGKTCQSAADCAGTDATFCESFVTKTCIIEKCAEDTSICPSGNVCCDMTGFIGTSVCTPESLLMNGLCPDQKAPVSQ